MTSKGKSATPAPKSGKVPAKKATAPAKPASKPAPVAKPASKPAPVAKPASQPAPAAKPASKPAPAAKPASKTIAPKAAEKSPDPKPTTKAPAPPILKKKAPPTESKSSSTRRTTAAPEPVKAAPAAVPVKPLVISDEAQEGEIKHSVFVKLAKQKLLDLKDALMDSMTGTASETLRNKAEGSEASAFGMHQADAGTDAYDRDFALSLLAQEQDALYEIEEALKRIKDGTYGVCEACNKRIPQARLEALPFARLTIDCQQIYEKEVGPNSGRRQVRSLFGLMGSEDEDEEGEEESSDNEKES
jgi:RNA polymerase-binding protein DksA